jgi:FkbM family methyltransferase
MKSTIVRGHEIFYCDNGCNVEQWLTQGHLYGEANYQLLSSLIVDDGIIVDAGAHIGTFSFVPVFDGKAVVLIEAAKENCDCLRQTFKDKPVEIWQGILADRIKKCRFSRDNGPFGWLIDDEDGDLVTCTLDAIVDGRKVSGLKLDIEGGEIAALDGAANTLAASKPPIIMEVNGYCLMQHNHRSEDLLKKVAEHDYAIFILLQNMVYRVDPEKLFPFCNTDVMCIHNDNLHKYVFALKNTMEDYEINYIAEEMCRRSNDDCKAYFKMIGIV